jgi:penicillin-binding protein 1B
MHLMNLSSTAALRSFLKSRGLRLAAGSIVALTLLALILFSLWAIRLDREIRSRLSGQRFLPPTEFYTAPLLLRVGFPTDAGTIRRRFDALGFRSRPWDQAVQPGDFAEMTSAECVQLLAGGLPADLASQTAQCWAFSNRSDEVTQLVVIDPQGVILAALAGSPLESRTAVEIEPALFAQFYGDQPLLREVVELGRVPTVCLNALIAIEDDGFLEHHGVSATGILRAAWANLRARGRRQGGSTLTQQLIKNYFLTNERTFQRKFTELVMAILIEGRATKDEILETYINLIYMGQNGPFEVRGYAAAARHYFGKPIDQLELADCALLAAIVNGPGTFDPFRRPEASRTRRSLVLKRMHDLKYISEEERLRSDSSSLPSTRPVASRETAPYFVSSVRRLGRVLGWDDRDGLRIYTTLRPELQELAQASVQRGLVELDSRLKSPKKLEAVLVSVDNATGWIEAIVGGRSFLASPFNRVYDAQRQVGSLMKPIVFLSALQSSDEQGRPITPLSIVEDSAFEHRYEGQRWAPLNYDQKFHGRVPLYFALKESLNIPAAKLGLQQGLGQVIDLARSLGIQAPLEPVPSLTLGSFAMAPIEMAQAYTTLARMGRFVSISPVLRVDRLDGTRVWQNQSDERDVADPAATAQLTNMLEQTVNSGTGQVIRTKGFARSVAGKTGTTNDKRDAWFAGYTPFQTAVVWVGHDDNSSHGLTGGSAAAPIWADFQLAQLPMTPAAGFTWPDSVEMHTVDLAVLESLGVQDAKARSEVPLELLLPRAPSN